MALVAVIFSVSFAGPHILLVIQAAISVACCLKGVLLSMLGDCSKHMVYRHHWLHKVPTQLALTMYQLSATRFIIYPNKNWARASSVS
jgi:CHASE2 domain-containing sensor protein